MAPPLGDLTRCLRMCHTVEETLFNLGLPPNRGERQTDFLVYDTVGRLPKAAVSARPPREDPPAAWSRQSSRPAGGSRGRIPAGSPDQGRAMPNDYGGSEKLLTKGEVAQLCRVEVRTVDRWLIAGKITCYRTPSGRVLFRRDDVLIAIGRAAAPRRSADEGVPERRGRREGRAYGTAEEWP
jgi:excisionase family DNA binding protein